MSHAEGFQVMCVDTMHQTGSTSPTLRERWRAVSPKRQEDRRTAFPGEATRLTPASSNVRKPWGQAGLMETGAFLL